MKKWEIAKNEKKPFKPNAKSINKYEVRGDIVGDVSEEQVIAVKDKVQK